MARAKVIDKRSKRVRQNKFLEKLEEHATVTHACRAAKVPRRTVYNWIDTDEAFRVQYTKSAEIAIHLLEDEAKRRAYEGVKETVYQGGKKVGVLKKYSDTLLIFLLKSLKGEVYREPPNRHEIGGLDGEPIKTEATVISNVDYSKLSTEALEQILAARIKPQD